MTIAAAGDPFTITLIIPTLNEAGSIASTLAALQPLRRRGHELIVVDGGSLDSTVAECEPLVDRLLHSSAGRARQMQAGVAAANGQLLWFLHADTLVPENAVSALIAAVQDGGHAWGRFDIRFAEPGWLLGLVARLSNLRSCLTGIATGDQGIFVTRDRFRQVNGYPQIALMEDVALSRALKASERPACLRPRLTTSARRWQKHGVLRTILLMWLLRLGYTLGISPDTLARHYPAHRA